MNNLIHKLNIFNDFVNSTITKLEDSCPTKFTVTHFYKKKTPYAFALEVTNYIFKD